MSHTHTYRTELAWQGSTAVGYDTYERAHRLVAAPALAPLELSSDPAFRGDPDRLNPEQLLLAAASSCQLLSFLAVAARARIDVVGYADAAEAAMPEDDQPMRLTHIVLRPVITLGAASAAVTDARLDHLVGVAHRECFIANSLRSEMTIQATYVRT
jgi:organic hydroperoxide reductase OsmC/OhrA